MYTHTYCSIVLLCGKGHTHQPSLWVIHKAILQEGTFMVTISSYILALWAVAISTLFSGSYLPALQAVTINTLFILCYVIFVWSQVSALQAMTINALFSRSYIPVLYTMTMETIATLITFMELASYRRHSLLMILVITR